MFTADDHTFVVCAYKENPFIGATIESLQNQTLKSKIILSTSTPNSYLKQICEQYSIQMVVNPNPQGAGSDWNYGFDAAETPLVTMAHQDDLYRQEFLANMLSAINQCPAKEVQLAFSDYYELRNGEEIDNNLILRVKRFMNAGFSNRHLNGKTWFKRRVLAFGDSICCPAVTLVKDTVEIVVQVNGKIKEKLDIAGGLSKEEMEKTVMENEKVKGLIEGKNVVKVIAVPGKLINIVVK